MNIKVFLGLAGVVMVSTLSIYGLYRFHAYQDHRDLQIELDTAEKEGLPVTWTAYAASIKSAIPATNAAPIYQQIAHARLKKGTDLTADESDLFLHPDPQHTALALGEIQRNHKMLDLADAAARLPRCWFNRNWSKGLSVLMPEFSDMKMAAKLVAFRGSIAAAKGKSTEAIRNIDEVFQIAKHSGEEGTVISTLVNQAIVAIGLHHLALWAFSHRGNPEYASALSAGLKQWPTKNLQYQNRDVLLAIRDIMALSTTRQGLVDLGIKEEDIPPFERLAPLLLSRPKANIAIAHQIRLVWEALALPPAERIQKIDAAYLELNKAMAAYPTGSDIYRKMMLGGESDKGLSDHGFVLSDQVSKAHRLGYEALARALGNPKVPATIDIDDLASPFDGKPVTYHFDGRQMSIEVSCPDSEIKIPILKLPSDHDFDPKAKN